MSVGDWDRAEFCVTSKEGAMMSINEMVLWFAGMISALLLYTGCGSSNTAGEAASNVVSERQLKVQDVAYSNENHIVLLSLEHPSSQQEAYDLDDVGNDCYWIKPMADLENIKLFIDDNVLVASISVRDLQNGEYVTAIKNDSERTFTFRKNKTYEFCATHDGIGEKTQQLFVQFVGTEKLAEEVGYTPSAIDTLKTTNKCIGCDLSYYDFANNFNNLDGMDLTKANLSESIMTGVSLIQTILNYADLTGVDFTRATMIQTKVEHVDTIDMNNFWPDNIDKSSFAYSDLSGFNINDSITRDVQHDINFSYANLSDANFSNYTLIGCSFNDANLSGADLRGVSLIDTKVEHVSTIDMDMFKPKNLDKSSFAYTDLSGFNIHDSIERDSQYGIDFSHAILRAANFSNYILDGCSFNYADLTGADLRDVSLTDTSVEHISTIDMDLFRPENLNGASFAYTDLSGLSKHNFNLPVEYGSTIFDFTLEKYTNVSFAHAILHGANLYKAKLKGADFSGADLTDANLSYVSLEGAKLSGSNLTGADLYLATIIYKDDTFQTADLSYVNLSHAKMHFFITVQAHTGYPDVYVNLSGANLSDADLTNAGLEYSCLSHITCHRTNFTSVNIRNSVLFGANCQDAIYTDADFLHVNHVNAIMPGAVFQYDEGTETLHLNNCTE